ncbi:DUF6660 family protein [Flavobacterium sp. ENC]|uniref:DUF6660 family protein n=1 Tax=Flavobacterium sp. ENC TaxID=2897330 RepID=UPI001E4C34AC|nr:hypothetical protein [Flavobacterium sp. ENC]
MKWINIILSVYLIVLSSLPCADSLQSDSIAHTNEMVSQTESTSHDKESDLCPPFCTCNCCAAQVLNTTPVIAWSFDESTPLIKKPLSSYHSVFTSNFYGSIWQPPQIV